MKPGKRFAWGCLSGLGLVFLALLLWWGAGQRRFQTWNWDWSWQDPIAAHRWESPSAVEAAHLEVAPQEALLDKPLRVFRVTGLSPGQVVGIRAVTEDKKGRRWAAAGLWQADDQGVVDLTQQAPLQGTYTDADPMGLFWSMRPVRPMRAPAFQLPSPAYTVTITVEVGDRVLAQAQVTRRLRSPGITCREIREGRLVGALCRPQGEGPFPAILLLSGSEGGYHPDRAAWWASHGVVAFSLAYFGVDPLPPKLGRIPVEHFLEGVAWLREQPGVDPEQVYVLGGSRGSEAALLTGLYADPPLAGVIAMMPSHVLWAGLDFSQGRPYAAWTYQGQDLPYAVWGWSWEFLRMMVGQPVRLRPVFEAALQKGVPEEAVIPAENIPGRILLVSATDDQMWPSTEMAQALVARMEAHGQGHRVIHVVLEGAGHSVPLGYVPPVRLIPPFLLGGETREANVYGGLKAWRASESFVLSGEGPVSTGSR